MRPSDGNEGCGVGVAGPLEGQEGVEVLQFDEEKVARLSTAGIALDAVVDRVPVAEPLCEREVLVLTRGGCGPFIIRRRTNGWPPTVGG
jgi:hypothetical protein